MLEDELEVAGRSQREDARGGEACPPVRFVEAPPLELLPDPGNDAGGLVREDVHNHFLPHPGQAAVAGLR
eukprot:4359158-Alexandrium_andersonii.AAC.1